MSQFVVTADDAGGVHTNSSIMNHAFYLAAAGLPNAIGTAKAEQIWYRADTTKLSPTSQFLDARYALIQSADELYGLNSQDSQVVAAAMDAVEIYDGQTNPIPGPVPVPQGADSDLFVFFDGNAGAYFIGRLEAALGDVPPLGSYLTNVPVQYRKMSITGDGSTVLFINSGHQLCVQPTDGSSLEHCSGGGDVWSVAVSPDGSLVAVVFADPAQLQLGTFAPGNTISVVDVASGTGTTYALKASAPDATSNSIEIEYADTLDLTSTNEFLIYDALNKITSPDGTRARNVEHLRDRLEQW